MRLLGGGGIAQWIAFALPNPAAQGSNPDVPNNLLSMLPRFIDGAAAQSISRQPRLNNVNQTHLVLVSGKPVLQKIFDFLTVRQFSKGCTFVIRKDVVIQQPFCHFSILSSFHFLSSVLFAFLSLMNLKMILWTRLCTKQISLIKRMIILI